MKSYNALQKWKMVCLLLIFQICILGLPYSLICVGAKQSQKGRSKRTAKPTQDEINLEGLDLDSLDLGFGEWKHILTSGNFFLLYHPKRLTRTRSRTVKVWVKKIPTFTGFEDDKARKEYVETRKKNGLNVTGYEKWSHTLTLYELKCSERKLRYLSTIDYDDDGKVLDSSESEIRWSDVIPESIGEGILEVICNKEK